MRVRLQLPVGPTDFGWFGVLVRPLEVPFLPVVGMSVCGLTVKEVAFDPDDDREEKIQVMLERLWPLSKKESERMLRLGWAWVVKPMADEHFVPDPDDDDDEEEGAPER